MMDSTTDVPQTTPNVNIILESQYRVYDGLIAVAICISSLIGLPGNLVSFIYFIQTEKRNLSTLLYLTACSIDMFSNVIALPVAANLFNKRSPGWLANTAFCTLWYFLLLLLQQMSMFVVMLLSLSRAIVITVPFYKIRKRLALLSAVVYLIYHFIWNIAYFLQAESYYSTAAALCQVYSESLFYTLFQANYTVCTLIPPVVVFLAFLTSMAKLKKGNITEASQRRNHAASVTITYFAAIFLSCNCFTFLNCCLYTITMSYYKRYPGPIYEGNFMFFYSWLLSELFCTILNAALNPLLYLWRMRDLRSWLGGVVHKRSSVVPSTTSSLTKQTETEL